MEYPMTNQELQEAIDKCSIRQLSLFNDTRELQVAHLKKLFEIQAARANLACAKQPWVK